MTQDELLELLERAKAEGWTVVTEAEEFDQSSLEELEWWAFLREMLERWGVPPGEEDSLENCLQWIDRQEQLFLSETLPPTEVMPRAVAENWRALDLAGRELETLPPELFELQQLEILILGKWDNKTAKYKGNNLTSLPPEIGQLSSLTQLDLSSNQLSSLPPEIGQLSSLTQLDLRYNQLSSLPSFIRQLPKLEKLDLRGNPIPIPPEMLGPRELYRDPGDLQTVFNFYFNAQRNDEPFYESKLLIVGEGGAGKTTLANKLKNAEFALRKDEETTEGIDILPWDIDHPSGNDLRVNIWDFGGQEIYHSTHQFFLTKRSVYVLVADDRREDTDFYYWLSIIKLLSDESPVIILKNEKQGRQCAIDERSLRSEFTNLRPILTADLAENNDKLKKLSRTIQNELCQLDHLGDPIPAHWGSIRAVLENISGSRNYIDLREYFDYCRGNGFSDEKEMLAASQFLHDLGICLHFQKVKGLRKVLILKPTWATNSVYKILDNKAVRANYGRFTDETLEEIWDEGDAAQMRDELLLLMMEFGLCYEIPRNPGQYISPQLLGKERPAYDWDDTHNLILRYEYNFKPKSIFPQFVVATHEEIENQSLVWKHGVVLRDGNTRVEIVEEDRYHKAEIKIRATGTNKRGLLSSVAREIEKLSNTYDRIEYKTLIPCNCPQCKTSQTPHTYEWNNLQRRLQNRRYEVECEISYDQVNVRSLIDDIAVPMVGDGDRADFAERGGRSSPFGTRDVYYIDKQIIQNQDMGNTINQRHSGSGDNVAGDKNVNTYNSNQQDLADAARQIKELLDQLSSDYDTSTPTGQMMVGAKAVEEVEKNPTLKKRVIGLLKGASTTAITELIKHPAAKIFVEGAKGFMDAK